MSKSLGNFFTIRDVLEKYHPEVVRFLLVSSHYRNPINYAEDSLIEARAGLERFYTALRDFTDVAPAALADLQSSRYYAEFVSAMNDDFNTRVALASLYDLVRELNGVAATDKARARQLVAELKAMAEILGILQEDPQAFLQAGASEGISAEEVEALIAERIAAKQAKNFARADEIRKLLLEQSVVLEDSRDGTTQWRRA